MDKGAHFYRCDFQVHSPRDIAWTGNKFGVDASEIEGLSEEAKEQIVKDREQFCMEYLDKIRNAGLNAIAMTDHHDVVFVKHLRKVARQENQNFIANEEFEKVVTVFPGIELSLSNPASQCILIFDADFSDSNLDSVINFLGINPTSVYDKITTPTERISQDIIHDLVHLHKKLDELGYCKNKYVILPNVGKGGQHSILRQGFHEHYRKMPCVGGYVDKAISNDSGYQNKLNGGDVNYGNKSIALISTSDNRFEDGRYFGNYATWIKWAEPTAEAIRQACLAKESRISQEEPELPQIYVHSIDVTNSKFLGSFDILLNQQYNSLIGGRGTGKSTVLEYLRWGLCDQTVQIGDHDELGIIEKRRKSLIKKTLSDVGGEVRITMIKNGIKHIVKRSSTDNDVLLKIGDADFEKVKEDDIRKILPIQSYSQKQLSDVGVKTEELKRFIEQPIRGDLDSIGFELREVNLKLRESYLSLVRKKEVNQEIENFRLESQSLNNQARNIRESLRGISDGDQRTISKKQKFEVEKTIIENSQKELDLFKSKADELGKLLELYPEPLGDLENLENKALISDVSQEVDRKFDEIKEVVESFQNIFDENGMKVFRNLISDWNSKKENFEIEYEAAKSKSKSSQLQLGEIRNIEARISEINNILTERKSIIKEIGSPEEKFESVRKKWKDLHFTKVETLNGQAQKFSQLSKNLIKAEVTKSIDLSVLKQQMKSLFEGTRIREERIKVVIGRIKNSDDPIDEFLLVLDEFRSLAELRISDDKSFSIPETPVLTECGYTEDHKAKLCRKIDVGDWLKMSAVELEFSPRFYYSTNKEMGDVIPFNDASAGQQATALLTVLLNQSGIPLLIDQPEDDIDNRAIQDIINNIWHAKKRRQLVFTSHNANLVVNGDAELVICCDYKDSSSQTRGVIKAEGAIDTPSVKEEITLVMEGGEKAFRLRKDKYGY